VPRPPGAREPAAQAARGLQGQVGREGRRGRRGQGQKGAYSPEVDKRQRIAKRDSRVVAQAGVSVLEAVVLLVAGDERQLRRGVRNKGHSTQVAPQHAA